MTFHREADKSAPRTYEVTHVRADGSVVIETVVDDRPKVKRGEARAPDDNVNTGPNNMPEVQRIRNAIPLLGIEDLRILLGEFEHRLDELEKSILPRERLARSVADMWRGDRDDGHRRQYRTDHDQRTPRQRFVEDTALWWRDGPKNQ
jgi:hypothetical protein